MPEPRIKEKGLRPGDDDVIRELVEKYSRQELVDMTNFLPFDKQACYAIFPRLEGASKFAAAGWFSSNGARIEKVAAYVARAADGGAAKVLERLVERREEDKKTIEALTALVTAADARGARRLSDALKKGKTVAKEEGQARPE